MKPQHGFTLIELLVVVATIAVLMAMAVFHDNVTMFGYGDGHSEKKTWDDPRTQRWSNEIRDGVRYPDMSGLSDPENVDIRWLAEHYPRKR